MDLRIRSAPGCFLPGDFNISQINAPPDSFWTRQGPDAATHSSPGDATVPKSRAVKGPQGLSGEPEG